MTTTDDRPAVIRHPVWCRHAPVTAPRAGDPVGCPTYYDRLAPPESSGEHEGREYRLDAGETFAYAVTVTPTQLHDGDGGTPRLRLTLVCHELLDADDKAYLSPAEARTLAAMLQHASREVGRG